MEVPWSPPAVWYSSQRGFLTRNCARLLRILASSCGRPHYPSADTATPSIYMVYGKQLVVIETNNMRDRKAPQNPPYVAFALPE